MDDNDLIAALYGTVSEDTRWTEVLDALKSRLGVASAVFQRLVADRDDLIPVISLRDTWSTQEATRHDAWANSPLNPRFRRDTEPRGQDEIESDHRCLAFSATDRENLKQGLAACGLGAGFWLGCRTAPGEHTTMIFHRYPGDGRDMTDADLHFMNLLLPHFRQMSRLLTDVAGIKARLSVAEAFMDSTSLALVACDMDLGVHWMNAAAESLVNGLPQVAQLNGRLRFRSNDGMSMVRGVIHGQRGDTCRVEGDQPSEVLHLRVLRRDAADKRRWGRNLALIALCSPGTAPRIDATEVAHLFGLTMAEATLTTHLVGGMTVKEFAAHRGIAEGTARMQLKSALTKAGVGRQADLVRQVCQSLARL
ncbi:helix-turn-helix transcriptional regulator [Novosphingobium taihuense]|uniref:DNA-binding CsgD family transcriptional regulator n=1 Tax=Novosphingobium taihuense TaxID=260085 RepID=A0A7W7EU05_9SPHN|nr:helix-turn-helix transcriptional regulator [Novosphingobium taihuense]MBB4613893.1 DNA-binding CsgD family transcriptional regulator [Novosphingobium taihuense]TWH86744.1 DNA-binding CsgD family transcriptional regulator [Novosphingobium taihuense]